MVFLPAAVISQSAWEQVAAMMDSAEQSLDRLREQIAFLELQHCVATRFPMLVCFSFKQKERDGPSGPRMVEISAQRERRFGRMSESDSDGGVDENGFAGPSRQLDGLRDVIEKMPSAVRDALEGQEIECRDPDELAVAVMGEEGFGRFRRFRS